MSAGEEQRRGALECWRSARGWSAGVLAGTGAFVPRRRSMQGERDVDVARAMAFLLRASWGAVAAASEGKRVERTNLRACGEGDGAMAAPRADGWQ